MEMTPDPDDAMIDLLDKALRRFLAESRADAAVVWGIPRPGSATVLTSCPVDLVEGGSRWPTAHHGAVDAVERDPDRLSRLLPASFRAALPDEPAAARSFQLVHGLFLTVVWCTRPVDAEIRDAIDQRGLDEVAYLAGLTADLQFNRGELQRLRAVMNGLHDAVVTVDLATEQTYLNNSAARLLALPAGGNTTADFRAAVTALAQRALNGEEFGAAAVQFRREPDAELEFMLRFAEPPTHLLVTSKAVRHLNFQGRIWVFYDESALSQALESAERTRDLLQISADGMLDPQALLEAARGPDGRIVDFVFRDVNRAACGYLRLDRNDLVGRTLLTIMPNMGPTGLVERYAHCVETREPLILDDFLYPSQLLPGPRSFDLRGSYAGIDSICVTWRDTTERFEAAQRISEAKERYRLLAENAGDVVIQVRDDRIVWASPSIEEALGAGPEYWIGRKLNDLIPAEDHGAHDKINWLTPDRAFIPRGRLIAVDGTEHWVHVHVKTFYDADGNPDGYTAAFRIIDDEVRAVTAADEARRRQAEADARYRRLMDNSAIGMCLVTPEGRYEAVNQALCDFFGLDAETLTHTTWQELTHGETLERDLRLTEDVLAGRRDKYRVTKQYIHSDGHLIWGDLSTSCLRDADGQVEYFISQIIDITAEVEARRQITQRDQQNRALAQRLQAQTDRLKSELNSAANYVRSILPRDMNGLVRVSSRYVPSRELGGDCFDHTWVDDEHLVVYLIDVSGHGIAPALLSVSVHNLLRSGTIPLATLLSPERVLAELNAKFQMDQHGENYFTMWYGVYESSTRTLRYASAGHPPALALTVEDGAVTTTKLATQSMPLGMFSDTEFTCDDYIVPPDGQLVLYSDGAFELPMPEGNASLDAFIGLCAEFAATPDWTVDELISTLQSLTTGGLFADDCSLIQLRFH